MQCWFDYHSLSIRQFSSTLNIKPIHAKSCKTKSLSNEHPHKCRRQRTDILQGYWWFLHVRRTWRNIKLKRYSSLQHDSWEQTVHSNRLWSRLSVWSTAGFTIKGRLQTLSTSSVDNLMTTAPFAYNISVPELNLAAIIQTTKDLMKKFLVMKGHPSLAVQFRTRHHHDCLHGLRNMKLLLQPESSTLFVVMKWTNATMVMPVFIQLLRVILS